MPRIVLIAGLVAVLLNLIIPQEREVDTGIVEHDEPVDVEGQRRREVEGDHESDPEKDVKKHDL